MCDFTTYQVRTCVFFIKLLTEYLCGMSNVCKKNKQFSEDQKQNKRKKTSKPSSVTSLDHFLLPKTQMLHLSAASKSHVPGAPALSVCS